jgi:glucose-1-phosphate adenylyltransferase
VPFAKLVSEYMSYPVHSVAPDARIADVRNQLDEMGISCLAVINESGALLGVISPADLVRVSQPSADGEGKLLVVPDREVSGVMSSNVVVVEPQTKISDVAERMITAGVHRVFVVEDGELAGVFTTSDIIRVVAEAGVETPISRYMSYPVGMIQATDSTGLAVERLANSSVDGVVVELGGRLVGVFTSIEALEARHDPPETTVEQTMDSELVCLSEDAPLHEAAEVALDAGVHQVAALRRDGSIGLLTGIDFARVAKREAQSVPGGRYSRGVGAALVMVMAGGKGSRLTPLTCHRAKPAVPFGGRYRIIDFVLSNVVNSGYARVYVLTQYMASSLINHINRNWPTSSFGQSVEVVPAQMRHGSRWYEGTADSVLQNLNLILDSHADNLAIFGGDHIYTFAVKQMERVHRDRDADLTVATFKVPKSEARHFGVIEVDDDGRILGFQEKPEHDPATVPGEPDTCLISMGNYFFRTRALTYVLHADAGDIDSSHDFGKDIIPRMIREGARVYSYSFTNNRIRGEPSGASPYWRDVGTIDSYFAANMELRSALPELNLYNRSWPIRSATRNYPPARFVRHGAGMASEAIDSLVCEGSILDSARLENVVASYDCFFHTGSQVHDAVVLSGCDIGSGCRLHRVLLDKNCSIAPGTVIGEDSAVDWTRFPFITASGLVVLPKGTHVPKHGPVELSQDMVYLLQNDVEAARKMASIEHHPVLSERSRHSYDSVGPRARFKRYGG